MSNRIHRLLETLPRTPERDAIMLDIVDNPICWQDPLKRLRHGTLSLCPPYSIGLLSEEIVQGAWFGFCNEEGQPAAMDDATHVGWTILSRAVA